MRIRIQDPKNVLLDPDPDPSFFIRIRNPKWVKIKEENLNQQIFNRIFLNEIKTPLKISEHKVPYYKRILTFMFPFLYSPNETVYFLGFFTSWIRIQNTAVVTGTCYFLWFLDVRFPIEFSAPIN